MCNCSTYVLKYQNSNNVHQLAIFESSKILNERPFAKSANCHLNIDHKIGTRRLFKMF